MKLFSKEIKIISLSIILGMCISIIIGAQLYAYAEKTQNEIASNVIRFHVRANSDLPVDQELKDAVRDRVLEVFKEGLTESNSVDETKEFLSAHLDDVISFAQEVVYEWGYEYPVTASIGTSFFPTRVYGNVVFPPGDYEALRINIGEAAGNNWWCIMFPPLCYVDMTQNIPEEEMDLLMQLIPEEGFKLLTHMSQDDTVKVRFKIVEWWQNRKIPTEPEGQLAIDN